MMKMSIAGTCLGLAVALSLRRYLPNSMGELSVKRMLIDTALVFGGYVYASKMATYSVYTNLIPLRKELVDVCDVSYLKHMLYLKEKYPKVYSTPNELFKDVY